MRIERKLQQDATRQHNRILAESSRYYASAAPQAAQQSHSTHRKQFVLSRILTYATCAVAIIVTMALCVFNGQTKYSTGNEMSVSLMYGENITDSESSSSGSQSSAPSQTPSERGYGNVIITESISDNVYLPNSSNIASATIYNADTAFNSSAYLVRGKGRVPLGWSILTTTQYRVTYDLVKDSKSGDNLYYQYLLDGDQYDVSIKTVVNSKYEAEDFVAKDNLVANNITVQITNSSIATHFIYSAKFTTAEGYLVIVNYTQSKQTAQDGFAEFLNSIAY